MLTHSPDKSRCCRLSSYQSADTNSPTSFFLKTLSEVVVVTLVRMVTNSGDAEEDSGCDRKEAAVVSGIGSDSGDGENDYGSDE